MEWQKNSETFAYHCHSSKNEKSRKQEIGNEFERNWKSGTRNQNRNTIGENKRRLDRRRKREEHKESPIILDGKHLSVQGALSEATKRKRLGQFFRSSNNDSTYTHF